MKKFKIKKSSLGIIAVAVFLIIIGLLNNSFNLSTNKTVDDIYNAIPFNYTVKLRGVINNTSINLDKQYYIIKIDSSNHSLLVASDKISLSTFVNMNVSIKVLIQPFIYNNETIGFYGDVIMIEVI